MELSQHVKEVQFTERAKSRKFMQFWIGMVQNTEPTSKPIQWIRVHSLPVLVILITHNTQQLEKSECQTRHGPTIGMDVEAIFH